MGRVLVFILINCGYIINGLSVSKTYCIGIIKYLKLNIILSKL